MQRTKMFIRVEPIRSLHETIRRTTHFLYVTDNCINDDYNTFFNRLLAHEETATYHYKNNTYKKRYGFEIIVMLPEYNTDLIHTVYLEALNQINATTLPSVCFYNKKRDGHYLHIILSERPYFSEGKEVLRLAKATTYRDKLTKRLCKKDNPNAEIVRVKGSIIDSRIEYFGTKQRILSGTGDVFNAIIDNLKEVLFSIMQHLSKGIPIGYFLKKIPMKNIKGSYLHRNASLWNKAFKTIDDELSELLNAGFNCDYDLSEEVGTLQEKYQDIIYSGKVTYQKKYKAPINIKSSYEQLPTFIDLFLRKFKEDLSDVYRRIFQLSF